MLILARRVSQMIDLFWSAVSLVSFWLLGALIFSSIEGWNYGYVHYALPPKGTFTEIIVMEYMQSSSLH